MSNNKEFDKNIGSHYSSETVLKEASDYFGKALRTIDSRSLVNQFYTHFRAAYDSNNNPTSVQYYRGATAHNTIVYTTAATALNNKHFSLFSAPDENKYTVWFNVDGLGTAPVVAGTYGYIEVPVAGTDNSTIVAMAIEIKINTSFSDIFKVDRISQFNHIQISTANLGETQISVAGTSGFVIENRAGTQTLVSNVAIDYSGLDPIYNGQVLKDYNFDLYSGKFVKNPEVTVAVGNVGVIDSAGDKLEVNPDGSINVNVISTSQVLKSYFNEVDNVATGVTTLLVTYTATANVYLQKIEFGGTNIAEFELTIDGVIKDKKRTSFYNYDNIFNFNQGLNILAGQIIRVYVVHTRPSLGSFSARAQILEG